MNDYILHFDFGHWQEKTVWTCQKRLVNFLRSGFAPKDCAIIVEHKGEKRKWNPEAAYAKHYRKAKSTNQFRLLYAIQEEKHQLMQDFFAKSARNAINKPCLSA